MSDAEYEFMKDSMKKLIKNWIDKATFINIQELIDERYDDKYDGCVNNIILNTMNANYTLEEFWEIDYKQKTSFYHLIHERYIREFPEDIAKLSKICYFFLSGTPECNRARDLINMMRNLDSYTIHLSDTSALEKEKFTNQDQYYDYYTKDKIKDILTIPENTKARKISPNRNFFEFNFKYDAMEVFFHKWESLIYTCNAQIHSNEYTKTNMLELKNVAMFISKLFILEPDLIEDMVTDTPNNTDVPENVKCIVDKLMRSLELLRSLDHEYLHESILALILDSIRVLIEHKFMNEVIEVLINFNDNTTSPIISNAGYSAYTSSNNGYFEKFLKDVESPDGQRLVSKAFTKLCSAIMKNSYPNHRLMSIVRWLKEIKGSKNYDNLEIYTNLMCVYKNTLMKFTTSQTKAIIEMKDISTDYFFTSLIEFLNDAEIERILNEVLEIENNNSLSFSLNNDFSDYAHLKYINKLYLNKFKELDAKIKQELQCVINSALDLLYVILELVQTQYDISKDKEKQSKLSYYHQFHIKGIDVVSLIKSGILSESSLISDVDENKLIFTVIQYIDFEHRYSCFETYEMNSRFVNPVISTHSSCSVSTNALKCTIQIIKLWERLPHARRPSLSLYYSKDSWGLSAAYSIISNALNKPEECLMLFECLSLWMNSQVGFMNTLLKDERILENLSETFFKNIKTWRDQAFRSPIIKRLIGMFIIFMSRIIQNKKLKNNKAFTNIISEFTANYLFNAEDIIYELFIERSEYYNNKFDMVGKGSYGLGHYGQLQEWSNDQILENNVKDVCFYNYVVSSYLLIISNMLTSLDKGDKIKDVALKKTIQIFQKQIFQILNICTSNRLTNTKEVLEEFHNGLQALGKVANIDRDFDHYGSGKSYVPKGINTIEDLVIQPFELQHQSIANMTKDSANYHNSLWNNMVSNFFGFGRSYCLDRNEIYYTMRL